MFREGEGEVELNEGGERIAYNEKRNRPPKEWREGGAKLNASQASEREKTAESDGRSKSQYPQDQEMMSMGMGLRWSGEPRFVENSYGCSSGPEPVDEKRKSGY